MRGWHLSTCPVPAIEASTKSHIFKWIFPNSWTTQNLLSFKMTPPTFHYMFFDVTVKFLEGPEFFWAWNSQPAGSLYNPFTFWMPTRAPATQAFNGSFYKWGQCGFCHLPLSVLKSRARVEWVSCCLPPESLLFSSEVERAANLSSCCSKVQTQVVMMSGLIQPIQCLPICFRVCHKSL